MDIDGAMATELIVDESILEIKGIPIASISLDKCNVMLCFEEYGYPVKPNGDPAGKPIKWRTKIHGARNRSSFFFFRFQIRFCF